VLGLEVVLADGRVLNDLSKLKKDNTGYNLRHLFVGAEGTLGFITAAVLKLFPKPRAVETAFIGLKSPAEALTLLGIAQAECGAGVTSFELMADVCLRFCIKNKPAIRNPLSGSGGPMRERIETILERGMEAGVVEDAVIADSLDHRASFWQIRDFINPAQKFEGGSIKHDISVPVASVPEFIARANEGVVKLMPGAIPVAFGHLGDGNIHFNLTQPPGADREQFLARWHEVNDVVHGVAMSFGGSISAEHGIGFMKRDELPHVKDKVAMELIRSIKATLDPLGILNPGKVV